MKNYFQIKLFQYGVLGEWEERRKIVLYLTVCPVKHCSFLLW
jgi:hypothetical protein